MALDLGPAPGWVHGFEDVGAARPALHRDLEARGRVDLGEDVLADVVSDEERVEAPAFAANQSVALLPSKLDEGWEGCSEIDPAVGALGATRVGIEEFGGVWNCYGAFCSPDPV